MNIARGNKMKNPPTQNPPTHDSAIKHATGEAIYIDDIVEPKGTLHIALALSDIAHGEILSLDLSKVKQSEGVVCTLDASDIKGKNDISPLGLNDDPIFAQNKIEFHGQVIFAVVAKTRAQAQFALTFAKVKYNELPPIVDIATALEEGGKLVTNSLTLKRGKIDQNLKAAKNRLEGSMQIGGQDHFYLEGKIALALVSDGDEINIYSSTQHPSEVQKLVAHALDVDLNSVVVKNRRVGGAFGGKESQSNQFAIIAALAAKKTGKAAKLRLSRKDDMQITGKRHDFLVDYDVAFEKNGKITALDANLAARCGFSADMSGPVLDRALFHADNCYFYPAVRLTSQPLKTNTVSNTAFRGFGAPQGMLMAERVIEEIAYSLNKDPLEVRKINFYGESENNITPYYQEIKDNIIARLVDELEKSSNYQKRRKKIIEFNKKSKIVKKGIALTPVKFGISFTALFYNQASALVHIYRDGTITLNHGGIEMGQGLYVKVAQVVANAFGVNLDKIKISATRTDKAPNTSPTAASAGADLNGMAALDAVNKIKENLVNFAIEKFNCTKEQVIFAKGKIAAAGKIFSFEKFIELAYLERTHLSSTGFYKTPDIHWNRDKGKGNPFFYFAYGAAVSEVEIDILTGEAKTTQVDILHDVGNSLNEAIDIGQVEGGFVQGMGWLTSEELAWNEKGEFETHAPATYKIPLASDIPQKFNVKLANWSKNPAKTIKRSKAVGEPPLMLAISVLEAISMAVASIVDYKICPRLNTPATPENILMSIERLKIEAQD